MTAGSSRTRPRAGGSAVRLLGLLLAMALAASLCGFARAAAERSAPWVPVVVHRHHGAVEATLSVERRRLQYGTFDYRKLRLQVALGGKSVFDRALCNPESCGPGTKHTLRFADVWGDAVPEVLLDTFSGGAHCCFGTFVAFLDGPRAGRTSFDLWGDPGYRLNVADGRAAFATADDRFAYAFTSFAASGLPVEVLALDARGRFEDVTRSRPDLVRADAQRWRRAYLGERGQPDADVRGILAAYCGDEYLLGQREACDSMLAGALRGGYLSGPSGWPQKRAYVAFVHTQLRKWGYAAHA